MNSWTWMILRPVLWFMTFTPSERVALISAILVLTGVIGEYFAEIDEDEVEISKRLRKRIKQLSMAVLLLGLGGDLLGIVMGQAEMTTLTKEAGDAATSAKIAHDEADSVKAIADASREDAKDALVKAREAQGELAQAEADSAKAQAAASNSLDIANKAMAHLSEAAIRADELTDRLKRLTTPRSLTSVPQVVASLKQFKGTEYLFGGICADEECADLLKSIDSVLQQAEWKRLKSEGGFPALNVFPEDPLGIKVTLEVGIKISTEVPNPSELVARQDIAHSPNNVQAATVLDFLLSGNVNPPEKPDRALAAPVNLIKGTSTAVRIVVGREPYE